MKFIKGRTLKDEIKIEGVGIHTGEITKIRIIPSEKKGIFFIKDNTMIPATHRYVANTVAATDLGRDGKVIRTVEHIMAAFYLAGIDSVIVEVKGDEIPILEGGAKTFLENFEEVGYRELEHFQNIFLLKEKVRVQPNGNFIEAHPSQEEEFIFDGIIPHIGRRQVTYDGKCVSDALIGARTFCLYEDVEKLKSQNLGLGGNLINTLVVDEKLKYVVYKDEPFYHKLLDLIGDLYLLGGRFVAKVYSFKGNHTLNHMFREFILKNNLLKKLEIRETAKV
jgi:UDP-3-O-[3-hydroxymyristoyl] N-acetylglucosamine deacetylase